MKKFMIAALVALSLFATQAMASEDGKIQVRLEGFEAGVFANNADSTFGPIPLDMSGQSGKGARAIVRIAEHWKGTLGVSQQDYCFGMAGTRLGCASGDTFSATIRWYPGDDDWKVQPYVGFGGYETSYNSPTVGNGALVLSTRGSGATGNVVEVGAKVPFGRFYIDGNWSHFSSGQEYDLKTKVGSALVTRGDISGVTTARVSLGGTFDLK